MSDTAATSAPPHVPAGRVFDIDIYGIPGAAADYQRALKAIHDRGLPDLFWTPRHGGHWVVTRHAGVLRVLSDWEHFSSRALVVPHDPAHAHFLPPIHADPPDHAAYRALLAPAFSPRAVGSLSDTVRATAIGLIEALRPRGGCEFVTEFAQHLPIAVFMGIAGVPAEDREQLLGWADGMVRPERREETNRTIQALFGYVRDLLARRRAAPGPDLMTRIAQGRAFDRALTDDEIVGMGALALIGGMDTVASAMGFAAHFLAGSPAHRRVLIERPALIPNAVDELLRRFGIVNQGRIVAKPAEIDGVALHPGDMVIAPTVLANLDERVFADPMTVDFERPNAAESATFGKGPHRCPGASLARCELRVFLEEWLARIPDFAVAPGERAEMSGGVNGTIHRLKLVWPAA